MIHFDVETALATLTVLVDTREQDTPALRRRLALLDLPHERRKLDYGDYSAKFTMGGIEHDMSQHFAIERKMSLDELVSCYTKGRGRFTREFERAREAGAKVYLLVENGDFEKMLAGEYRSKMHSKAIVASVFAWMARYKCSYLSCSPASTPHIIREICYRETKEYLEGIDEIFNGEPDKGCT